MAFIEEIRKQRGWVLRILERVYPDGLDQDTLKNQLIDLKFVPSEPDIRGILAYLEQKGFIKLEKLGGYGLLRHIASLTVDGKDLLEKNRDPDPGVDIG